jgi:hypothetical protein
MPEEINQNKVSQEPKVKTQTLADDMAKALQNGEGGMIGKIIKEQEYKEAKEKNASISSNKNILFTIIGIVLVLATIILFVVITFYRDKVVNTTVEPKFVPVIFLDKTDFIDVTGFTKDKIAQAVSSQIKLTDVKAGGVEGIYLTKDKKIIGFRDLMTLISGNLPLDKATFLSDNYLIGVSNIVNTNQTENETVTVPEKNFFILLQNRSMSDIFSAMRDWEDKMFFDLHGFFGLSINVDTNYLLQKDFEDGIIQNKNARILRDNEGKIVLMYVYANNTSVLITNSEDTSKEVITRLAASQVRK